MVHVIQSELDELDRAFSGNRLLATFPSGARAALEPYATLVEVQPGDTVFDKGKPVQSSLFPFNSTMISLVVEQSDGRSIEVASIGREGAVGGIVSCGHAPAFSHGRVQVGGPALKVPLKALEEAKVSNGHINHIFCRFSDYLLAQVMQSVSCNAFHSIPARAARWLLTAQDRAGDRIELTQEALAGLLGVQRTTVNAVIRELQDEGLIATGRGMVHVVNRAGLTRRACECYHVVESHFADVIGPSGTGGSPSC
ncbi:MAG TPA: Crp/Fnr family transcriptional regulator [Sphingomicrobium sp.]|jgi:CRP-like cAMP-binding protein